MSGPIIRSGPSSKYSKNWEAIFGSKQARPAAKKGKTSAKKGAKKKKG